METPQKSSVEALIVALPETAGSALYGMVDVLAAAGKRWQELTGSEPSRHSIKPRILAPDRAVFVCGNRIPVAPDFSVEDDPDADIVILPEMWLAPDDDLTGRYPDLLQWIRTRYRSGSAIYSACSGAVLLAATGLLAGREATSHWGYGDLFRSRFPEVRFNPEPSLAFGDAAGRIVTAGGATSWHDLAIHIISRHCSPGEALKIAKVYMMKGHGEGQLPYASLVRRHPHADAAVRTCEKWLDDHFHEPGAVAGVVAMSGIPERSLKRRFKVATGTTLIACIQNLRVEEAKRLLEAGKLPIEDIVARVGYENLAFFRRLFKRSTGLTPGQYRRMFRPLASASSGEVAQGEPASA